MSHNIFKKCVYSYLKPMWHNITEPSLVPMTAEGVLDERFGGGFQIHLRPVTVEMNGAPTETGDFAVIRGTTPYDPQEVRFGFCTDRYHPLQPREIAQQFDTSVGEFVETMAFLGEGEQMFISWKMPNFDVVQGDEVETYGIVKCGFDTLKGAKLFTSIYRPVCANTLTLAEDWAKRNNDGNLKGSLWTGRGVNKNLLRDLGYWMAHVQGKALEQTALLKDLFSRFAHQPIKTDEQAQNILYEAYPDAKDISAYYPAELRKSKQESTEQFNKKQAEMRDGIFELFAGAGTAITPDYWGILSSGSEYFCHYQPSKRPIAESVMFGARKDKITRMVSVLSEKAR